MGADPQKAWTQEASCLLERLWKEGKSATDIAREFSNRTRNAIIGRINRMGLSGSVRNSYPQGSVKKNHSKAVVSKVAWVKPSKPVPDRPAETQEPSGKHVSILEATYHHCRAVIDPRGSPEGLAIFCGEPVEEGKFYKFCPYHMKRYTVPPRARGEFYVRRWGSI